MPKTLLFVNFVTIPAAFFMSSKYACILKMRDYPHGRALSDANTVGHIPHAHTRVLGQTN